MSLLSCLQAVFRRVGGMEGSFEREEDRLHCTFSRIGGDFSFRRVDTPLSATATRVGNFHAYFGMVCSTGLGSDDVLWASDQMVLTIEGNKIYVMRA